MEENLENLIEQYYDFKNRADDLKKAADNYNKDIKDNFAALGISEYSTKSGFVAKITIQNRESFKEDMLVQKLKELGATTAVKTIEVPDMEEIENLIYNGKLDASKLADCKETKQVTTLKVTQKKVE